MSLQVDHLTKEFVTASGKLTVLRDVSFEMKGGDALAVMGPSGSGKSTMLHILGTLDRPTGGRLTIDGQNPFELSEAELAAFRNRKIGFVFQDHHLLPQCTALENVLIPTLVGPASEKAESERWARELLQQVGLAARMDHRATELSGGERQRVAIARALVHRPPLLLADEPTGNLDRSTGRSITELLLRLHHQQQTMLIAVTHSSEFAAAFPRQCTMIDGNLQPDPAPKLT